MTEYTRRQLRDITKLALRLLDSRVSEDTRGMVRAALARLDSQDKTRPDLREPYVYRARVQPGLWLTVDASHNIMLEVRSADEAELLAAYALSSVAEFRHLLDRACSARDEAEQAAERDRQLRVVEQAGGRWRDRAGNAASRAQEGPVTANGEQAR
jgi:hypothetical protein